jgi:glyoxylase-like metal-dependent hydrolase (beta-lactamase superfamily II)
MDEIAPGIFRWTARHPEWHPGSWGAEVASFAVREPGRTLLVDPLLGDKQWAELDAVVDGDVQTLITIPYHVRSAAEAAKRYGGSIWGHRGCRKRLAKSDPFEELSPGSAPEAVRPIPIGKPRRHEMPLLIESCGALCFGDSVVGVPGSEGPLRIWFYSDYDESWYRQRFLPTLQPLKELDVQAVLVTHGDPVVDDARAELRRGLERDSWYHRPG